MGISALTLVENRSTVAVRVLNRENPSTPGNGVAIQPGTSLAVNMWVPWAAAAGDFPAHHLEIQVGATTKFWMWQAGTDQDGDHVRFSIDGMWHDHGRPVHGISAVDGSGEGVRTLVVWDNGIELRALPSELVDEIRAALGPGGARLVGQRPDSTVASVPKSAAYAFSMAGPAADAFRRGQAGARFLYRDSGTRYAYQLQSGVVVATDPQGAQTPLTQAVSYHRKRVGELSAAPQFDLIAANGGRIFAKEKDADRFFFATMDEEFIHADDLGHDMAVPSTYFKLDPEFGQPGARTADLVAPFHGFTGGHPAGDRFPTFELGLAQNLVDVMMVAVKPRVWHQLDTRPPSGLLTLEALGLQFLIRQDPVLSALDTISYYHNILASLRVHAITPDIAPPAQTPTVGATTYTLAGTTFTLPAIDFDRVLDIGVGHAHWHEQYDATTGGEMQPMRNPKWILPGVTAADLYRFLNGPVADGDGYVDGTCNYYALVRLRGGSFALLFCDEQSYFSQRWRLAHPDDNKGLMGALSAGLASSPDLYDFDKRLFWSPFADSLITSTSRIAVSRQVVLVSGTDPQTAGAAAIFSINFSWGSIDRTWRWRTLRDEGLRPLTPAFFASDSDRASETISTAQPAVVYPETVRLREDMMIHAKGTRTVAGKTVAGRWVQRYLPANHSMPAVPATPGSRPGPYGHPWTFWPEPVFRAADHFHHLGVYDTIDSRRQYYVVQPVTAADEAALAAAASDPAPWTDPGRKLRTYLMRFHWAAPLRGIDINVPKSPLSLVNPDTRLRVTRRGTQWIATHDDKRDDDLIAFDAAALTTPVTGAPVPVTLTKNGRTATVTFGPNTAPDGPPQADQAIFTWTNDPAAPVTIALVNQSRTWRVRMAALDPLATTAAGQPPQVVTLLDVTFDGRFQTVGATATWRWTPTAAEIAQLAKYCTADLAMAHGTSIWIEDVTGQVAVADKLTFLGAPPAPAAAQLWQTTRRADGSWLPKADLLVPLGLATPVTAVTSTSTAPGEVQFLLSTRDGRLWHALRHPNGTVDRAGDATGQIGQVGTPSAVAAVSAAPGEAQFMISTVDGALWHTMRHSNGSWDRAGDPRGQFGPLGHVRSICAATFAAGEAWYVFATDDGALWHTTRHGNGSWDKVADLRTSVGNPGTVTSVAATSTTAGELQLILATVDGGLWHALRHPNGTWDRLGDVRGQIGNRGITGAVSAASAAPGEAQFLYTTTAGGIWHTIRHANGGWDGAGDVHGPLGPLTAASVAATATGTAGEVQFLLA